jgi:hypothetical protein
LPLFLSYRSRSAARENGRNVRRKEGFLTTWPPRVKGYGEREERFLNFRPGFSPSACVVPPRLSCG